MAAAVAPTTRWAGAAVVALGALALAAWPYTVDDAFIVARYAEHLASGRGYAMNPGGAPSDGVTALAWVLPMLAAAAAGVDPLGVAKGLGLVAGALAAGAVVVRSGRRGPHAAGVTALAVALSPTLGIWSVAGLETGLAALLVTVAGCTACDARRGAGVVLGLALGALAWLRPECALLGLVLVASLGLARPAEGLTALALSAALAGTCLALRLVAFGDPLPLSFYAKPAELAEGLAYVGRGLVRCTGGLGALLVGYAALRGERSERVLGAALGAHLLAIALAGGDWMPGHRLFAPLVPLHALLLGAVPGLVPTGAVRRAVGGGALLVALGVPALDLGVALPAAREAGRARETRGAALADLLAREHRVVAMVDVGYLAHRSDVEVVDLGGVTDPVVARAPGGYLDKAIDTAYLAHRAPDAILLHASAPPEVDARGRLSRLAGHPVERRLAATPWLREGFAVRSVHPYAPRYFYVLLTRRDPVAPGSTPAMPDPSPRPPSLPAR